MIILDLFDNTVLGKILAEQKDDEDATECPMPKSKFAPDMPLAMAYVPFQIWETPYDTETALSRGTIFPSLDKPFIGEEAVKNANSK